MEKSFVQKVHLCVFYNRVNTDYFQKHYQISICNGDAVSFRWGVSRILIHYSDVILQRAE
jgi:hypothetical protein